MTIRFEGLRPVHEEFSPPERPREERIVQLQDELILEIKDRVKNRQRPNSRMGIKMSRLYGRMMEEYVKSYKPTETSRPIGEMEKIINVRNQTERGLVDYYGAFGMSRSEAQRTAKNDLNGFLYEHVARTMLFRNFEGDAPIYYSREVDDQNGVDFWMDFRSFGEESPNWAKDKLLAVQVKGIDLNDHGVKSNKIFYALNNKDDLRNVIDFFGNDNLYATDGSRINHDISTRHQEEIYGSMIKSMEYTSTDPAVLPVLMVLPSDFSTGFAFPETLEANAQLYDKIYSDDHQDRVDRLVA